MPHTEPEVHPTRELETPTGLSVQIDVEMVPVVTALWRHGLTTLGCCQDSGEYAAAVRAGKPDRTPTGHAGYLEYYRGWAWLKMPVADTIRLTNALAETSLRSAVTVRWQQGSWRIDVPLVYDARAGMSLAPAAQIYLPCEQLSDLTKALATITIT